MRRINLIFFFCRNVLKLRKEKERGEEKEQGTTRNVENVQQTLDVVTVRKPEVVEPAPRKTGWKAVWS